jgi:peroxiredoxin Q/BCP
MNIGDKIPSIDFEATSGLKANFSDYLGQWMVLYFYPKDATPGCTTEGCDFRDNVAAFPNTTIFGISRDSLSSHERFKEKQQFSFELISDADETLCQAFDVIKMKNMYGKQVRGIERSTFIIDPNGVVSHVWRKVSVKGHVLDVLSYIQKSL